MLVPREPAIALPPMVCLRVTRFCNARCGFCLAPPDGAHPDAATLEQRIAWLREHGVRTIHFCGGEPTIHPALPRLLEHTRALGAKSKVTTNGIKLTDELLATLRRAGTEVKVSVHGDASHHDAIVGCDAFTRTEANLRRLVAAGVRTSVQTTVVARGAWVVDWIAAFCLDRGVRRMSVLPFIPRGLGRTRDDYALTDRERRDVHDRVNELRRSHRSRLDVRWLDFATRPFHVLEADGRLVLEHRTEAMDTLLRVIEA